MRRNFQRTLSLVLSLTMLWALSVPAAASEAMGEDLYAQDILLHEQTQLSNNVFWSSAYSDLRTEQLITYTPNKDVTPIVTFGDVLTDRTRVDDMAAELEQQGYRVVAGVNGDFYNTNTGLPIGLVVTDGLLHSSDSGYYAVGFREDGTAVLGKPGIKVSADLGYGVDDGWSYTQYIRQIAGVNKSRVSEGGIFLYTYAFNDRHTTGTTEPGIDVVCTVTEGELAIGSALRARVERVEETSTATELREDEIVLSVNLKSNSYYVDVLRNIPLGTEIELSVSAADEAWNDVEYAVGALYSLVENGQVVPGLPTGLNPRTAVGQRPDGTLVFYTMDGRRGGHSIGCSLTQVGERLMELGCETAVCLDGGGSTTLVVTDPGDVSAQVMNRPSEGSARAVTNQIFLVADDRASGRLSHFVVRAEDRQVMAGSKTEIAVSAVDTNYIPLRHSYALHTDGGSLKGNTLTAPDEGGIVTVTATSGGRNGSTTVRVVDAPDTIQIYRAGSAAAAETRYNGTKVSSLTLTPGTAVWLWPEAAYNHLPLAVDADGFAWSLDGEIGTLGAVSESGAVMFEAANPGEGTITIAAGEKEIEIPVTVTTIPLRTVEDFEGERTIFDGDTGDSARFAVVSGNESVKFGRRAGRVEYSLTEENFYQAVWNAAWGAEVDSRVYNSLNLWVYGDGSGNEVYLLHDDGEQSPVVTLDFTGWKQVALPMTEETYPISGLLICAPVEMDEAGEPYYRQTLSSEIYIDQMIASFAGTMDNEAPVVTAELDSENWVVTASAADGVDGILPQEAVSVFFNNEPMEFSYQPSDGTLSWALPGPGESGGPWRVTVTAKDASGNIGRASMDIPAYGEGSETYHFTDIDGYWGATYVDYLYDAGITTGYEDGTFRPDQKISRAQFAVMLYRYLGLDEGDEAVAELPFADLDKIGAYALPAIRALYADGIINGTAGADGKLYFNPNGSLTRAQAAAMIGRTQEKGYASVDLPFADAGKIPAYASEYIRTMAAQGVISGYADGTFRPGNHITRGQMAKILYNLM